MSRTICIALMALPIYLSNAGIGFACGSYVTSVENQSPIIAALMVDSTNASSGILPWQMSARDDQTEDCLRSGICKD